MATQKEALQSLKDAADAAHSAFLEAAAIDPIAAKPLWVDSIDATNTYLKAQQQALQGEDAAVSQAKAALDTTTQQIQNQLDELKDVATAINLVTQLLTTMATLAKFFA